MKIRQYGLLLIPVLLIGCGGMRALERAMESPEGVKTLRITKTNVRKLPNGVGKLVDLENLVLSFNELMELPAEIGQLKKLRRLSVQGNRLESIPPEIGTLPQLRRLDLRFNKLSDLPESLGQLASLQYLNIAENNLQALPQSLTNLKELQFLYIGQNDFPEGELMLDIMALPKLQEISLHGTGNMIAIPQSWGKHPRLERIYVDRTAVFQPMFGAANPRLRVIAGSPDLRNTVVN